MSNRRCRAFSLTEALVLLAVLTAGLSLALACEDQHQEVSPRAQHMTQLRGIHQSQVIFAQSNNAWFTGYDRDGEPIDLSTEYRLQVLLEANYFTGDYIISPMESLKPWRDGQDLTHENYSYAFLALEGPGKASERNREWSETINTWAAVMADRNTGPKADAPEGEQTYTSIWSDDEHQDWRGAVVRNDNSVSFVQSPKLAETRYGRGEINEQDHLFEAEGGQDALMTFSRDDEGQERHVALRPREDAAHGEHADHAEHAE